jgi:hypothetical protein
VLDFIGERRGWDDGRRAAERRACHARFAGNTEAAAEG